MAVSRRRFLRDGATTLAFGVSAPPLFQQLALAQSNPSRVLVILDLAGGNDSLSMVVPYTDQFYYSRRPTIAVPAGQVLQIGADASGRALGLHPRLAGLWSLFNEGRAAFILRAGYENSSRSHFLGTDIWSTARPDAPQGYGWAGRYLDTLPRTLDPLYVWSTVGDTPRTLRSSAVPVASIPSPSAYTFSSPNTGAEASYSRAAAAQAAFRSASTNSHLSLVGRQALSALETLDRVAMVSRYVPTVTYPSSSFAQALRAVAGTIALDTGTRVAWVQTGGYDTHSAQGVNPANGAYSNLMGTLDAGLSAFVTDLRNRGLLDRTLILQFSEFGRRVSENGSQGTDHGAASVMTVLGGSVKGGLYGTAPSLNPDAANPALENNGGDVRYENDFRSVYATIIDRWLGADSVSILGANYRSSVMSFL